MKSLIKDWLTTGFVTFKPEFYETAGYSRPFGSRPSFNKETGRTEGPD
jgi:hypothetical protein